MRLIKLFSVFIALVFIASILPAQIFADFETPETTPVLQNGNAAVVENPYPSDVNPSSYCAMYEKASGNWQFINMLFDSPIETGNSTNFNFKLHSSTQGRVYFKLFYDDQLVMEAWAHDYHDLPPSGQWVELSPDIAAVQQQQFNRVEIAAGVDNNSPATVYLDDLRLFNVDDELGFTMQWSSEHVFYGKNGKLEYKPDSLGNIIPDFSHVGYYYGDVPIPDIPVVMEIEPLPGENTLHIRNAILEVAAMPLDENGFRGAILLKKGVYNVGGSLNIFADGIVLRGEGSTDDEDGTIIVAQGTGRRPLIDIGSVNNDFAIDQSSRTPIIEDYVPVGRQFVRVENPENFQPGDLISLYRPGTQNWISDLRMDQIPGGSDVVQWEPQLYSFHFERIITHISGDSIFFRNPVVMAFDSQYGGGEVMKVSISRFKHIGIENMLLKSVYAHDTDEEHSWDAIFIRNAEHSWVRDVVAKYFAYSAVNIDLRSKHISVINCQKLEPKSQVTGGRRYAFKITGQLNLIKDCYATEGRHDYNTNARVRGPNTFVNSVSAQSSNDNGPHHRWAMGTLYDQIVSNNALNVQDRGASGTGHGWAGVNQVFWNSRGMYSICQNPWVSGVNYNIGWQGAKSSGWHNRPDGIWEGHNITGLFPESLYDAQLLDRMSDTVFFSVLPLLGLLSDTTYLLTFNMEPDPQSATDKANYTINGTAGAQDLYWEIDMIGEKQVKFTFFNMPLLLHDATIFIDASKVVSSNGKEINGLSLARHTEPDKRPVVFYSFQRVGNGPEDYVTAISSKKGKLYLVKDKIEVNNEQDLVDAVQIGNARVIDVLEPNTTKRIYTQDLIPDKYFFFATDDRGRLSRQPHTFVLIESSTFTPEAQLDEMVRIASSGRTIMVTPLDASAAGALTEIFDTKGSLIFRGYLHSELRVNLDVPGIYIIRVVNLEINQVVKMAIP